MFQGSILESKLSLPILKNYFVFLCLKKKKKEIVIQQKLEQKKKKKGENTSEESCLVLLMVRLSLEETATSPNKLTAAFTD